MGFLKLQFCMCTLLYREILEIRDEYKIILTNYRKYKLTKTQESKQNTLGCMKPDRRVTVNVLNYKCTCRNYS